MGVKAPGTAKMMTFLPAEREWMVTDWGLLSSSRKAKVPSGITSPTLIGAIEVDCDGVRMFFGNWDWNCRKLCVVSQCNNPPYIEKLEMDHSLYSSHLILFLLQEKNKAKAEGKMTRHCMRIWFIIFYLIKLVKRNYKEKI